MTYNIHHAEGVDKKIDLERIAAIIQSVKPEVVCLQEVDKHLPRTRKMDFPALLAKKMGMAVVFEPNYLFDGGQYGNATLTTLPIISHENIALPGGKNFEPRGCLRTVLQIGKQTIEVLNTHLGLNAAERNKQVEAIMASSHTNPIILAGDMNETGEGPAIQILQSRFHGAKINNDTPASCIDFILATEGLDILSSRLLLTPETNVASDHKPIVAEISLRARTDKVQDEGVHDTDDEQVTEAIVEGT